LTRPALDGAGAGRRRRWTPPALDAAGANGFAVGMRIGELAQAAGVSTDTIRFYERSGALPRAPRRRDNAYRTYDQADLEHVRLLLELRRLDLPLTEAARIASWCHSGHCVETTSTLPALLRERRGQVAARIASLRKLDERLAELERHLRGPGRHLPVIDGISGGPVLGSCCEAAAAVMSDARACGSCLDPEVTRTEG